MDLEDLPWQRRLVGAVVVFIVLLAIQYYQNRVDWSFLVAVAVVYFALAMGIDAVRHRE